MAAQSNSPEFAGIITESIASSQPSWPQNPTPPAGAPNVIVMLVDDMGYSDIGAFGSEIPTPHLDAVAGEGVRMTDFHVTPTCSPTRASLLTGCNSHAVGMGAVANVDDGFPGYAAELPANQPTVAEMLRDNGYSTMAIGKWHLCRESDMHSAGNRHSWPLQRGFDQYYGFLEAQSNLHFPHQLYEGNNPVHVDQYPEGYYLTDDLTDRAVQMIADTQAADPSKPFMMYFAHAAVHTPMHVKPADMERFRGKYAQGWDAIREARLERQKSLGVVPPGTDLSPRSEEAGYDVPAWDELSDDGKALAARHMEGFAAMVGTIDESVGKLRDVLDRLGKHENTIFIFLSDNGASGGGGHDVGAFNHLANLDRSRVVTNADRIAEQLPRIDEIGGPTSWPQYASGWATVSNTPFRRHKFSTYRGGHQVSFLMSWPAGLPESAGAIRHQYAHVTDLVPTLMDLIGLPVSTERHGLAARPLDGTSMAELLRRDDAVSNHTEQYYECLGERAYYAGDWEVVAQRTPMTPFDQDRWELFETAEDFNQLNNLAAENPERVEELIAAWRDAAERNQVFPMANGSPLHWFQRDPLDERFATDVVLLPETPTLERFRASQLIDGRSFEFEVELTDFSTADEGVLLAHGGQESGYMLYIEAGQLHLVQNAWGRMIAAEPVPLRDGTQRIRVTIDAPGKARWLASIFVDGECVQTDIQFVQLSWLVPFSGLYVGAMRRSPISWDLHLRRGVFAYSGRFSRITFRPGNFAPDAMATMLDHFREMGAATQ
ncbi:hypothetical protein B2J88_15900 [Rhodococcus sp. SRB_17]|nr:hypothetical protein [Rhodococcus sp. SRB_17]